MYKKPCFPFLAALLALSLSARGQSSAYQARGAILDSAGHTPLVSATVYVSDPKDSTVIALDFTDDRGAFVLKGIPRGKEVLFRVFYTGYRRYHKVLKDVQKDKLDFGNIALAPNDNMLGTVTVTGEKPPIAIRGDTIEFNASSFKTRPNSVLSALLKKLPGIEVDRDGSIRANGKKVDRILVDGKQFFGDDPQIALQNLPAGIVDKVQVTDTKTREEELAGEPAKGDTKTINITLQKGKDHGFFGRAYAGYGTGKHYDASALLNYFTGKRRISLLGAVNNINQTGFSIGEIMDMMGGPGGIHSISINKDAGSFGINGISFGGGGEGFKKSTSAGINYSDDYGKHFSLQGSYFYGDVALDNETKTARQNILPDSIFYYNADNVSHSNSLSHRVNATLNYKDSLWRVYYEPHINIGSNRGTNRSVSVSTGPEGDLINQSNSLYTNDDQTKRFMNSLNVYRMFNKKGRFLNLYANVGNNTTDGTDYHSYRNVFYDGSAADDSANQYIDNHTVNNRYTGGVTYKQPLTKHFSLNMGYSLNWQHSLTDKKTFNYDDATGKYNKLDSAYSNKFRSNVITQIPQAGLTFTGDSGKWRLDANANFNFIGLHHYSFTQDVSFDQNQFFISPEISLTRQVTKNGSLRLRYNANIQQPGISQLLPVADNSNPLYQVKGNPDLKPSVNRNIQLNYSTFDFKSGNNIWLTMDYHVMQHAIVNVTTYDDQLRQLTTYTNVNGNKGFRISLNLSKLRKKPDYHWRINLGTTGALNKSHAYVNSTPYISRSNLLSFRPSFTYGYKELVEVAPFYRFDYRHSRYDVKSLNDRTSTVQQAGLTGTLYWPSRVTWASDLNYTHNSEVAPGFRKGYWLWNASVSLDVFKNKQGTFQFSVYDLLDQNISVRRNITDTYIEDTQTTILHRYFMLKFVYNLRKFGEKKKKERVGGPMFFF